MPSRLFIITYFLKFDNETNWMRCPLWRLSEILPQWPGTHRILFLLSEFLTPGYLYISKYTYILQWYATIANPHVELWTISPSNNNPTLHNITTCFLNLRNRFHYSCTSSKCQVLPRNIIADYHIKHMYMYFSLQERQFFLL